MTALRRAGFGERAGFAYAVLLNNAMLTVSIGDDRLQHEGDGARDHAKLMVEFDEMPTASEEVRALGSEFMRPFAEGGETAARMRDAYYRFVVDTTIAGLDAVRVARGGPAGHAIEQKDPT